MLGYTHTMFGVATAALAIGHDAETLILAGVGALLPDIDDSGSTLGRYVPPPIRLIAGAAACVHGVITGGPAFVASGALLLLSSLLPHRSITHSLLALFLVNSFLPLPLALGYATHIVADIISGGVPLLWPWSKRIGFSVFKTSGVGDALLLVSSFALLFFSVILPRAAWL